MEQAPTGKESIEPRQSAGAAMRNLHLALRTLRARARPSRVAAAAVIVAVVVFLTNFGTVAFGFVNLLADFGSHERRADLRYGPASRQTLDVYVPSGASRRPVVLFWYGGSWINGARERYRFVGAALANAGYVAVVPDYRLYPQVRFPTFQDDAALALRWTREHAAEFGGDPQAIFLMGHSAGAHIAATLVLDDRYLRKVGGSPDWVRGWIGVSGPYALEMRTDLLLEVFRSSGPEAWQPIGLVRAHTPPALLLHGTDDTMVHPRETVELEQKLTAVGVPAECHLYPYRTHEDTVAAFAITMRSRADTLHNVTEFIERTLAGKNISLACPDLVLRRDWAPGGRVNFNGG
jgi:acetyl esterase/lipase